MIGTLDDFLEVYFILSGIVLNKINSGLYTGLIYFELFLRWYIDTWLLTGTFNFYLFFTLTQGHFFIAFRERGREREKQWSERETWIPCFLYTPGSGMEPETQVHVLTGNWTHNPLVTGQCSSQLSHTGQSLMGTFKCVCMLCVCSSSFQPPQTLFPCFFIHSVSIVMAVYLILR